MYAALLERSKVNDCERGAFNRRNALHALRYTFIFRFLRYFVYSLSRLLLAAGALNFTPTTYLTCMYIIE